MTTTKYAESYDTKALKLDQFGEWKDDEGESWYTQDDLDDAISDAELNAYDRGYEDGNNTDDSEADSLRLLVQDLLDTLPYGLLDQLRRDDLRFHQTLTQAGF